MSKNEDRASVIKLVSEWVRLDPLKTNDAIRRHEIEHRLMALNKSGKLKKLL
jgi:hypothetical protein